MWHFFHEHGRDFPWRQTNDPYEILVSEFMLQQTQTAHVSEKFVAEKMVCFEHGCLMFSF